MAAMIWLAWNVYDSNRFVEELKHRHIRCVQLQGVIIHLDEVLTMSARMATETGDLNWEKRHRHYEPELKPRTIHLRVARVRGKESRGELGRRSVPVSLWSVVAAGRQADTKTDTKGVSKSLVR